MKSKQPIRVGDVFKTTLPDGRIGTIRILKSWDTSFLVATTPYISTVSPEVSDPLLKSVIVRKRFSWNGAPALCIYSGKIPSNFEFLTNLPLSAEEENIKPWGGSIGFPSGGSWRPDRAAYEAEVRLENEQREKARRVQPKPKKMMADENFWELIALLDWNKSGNDDAVVGPLVKSLAALKKADLCRFHETLCYKLFLLDTEQHAKSSISSSSADWQRELSSDGFLYLRCVVVANGREYYEKVLLNPESMPRDLEFEALIYVSRQAYAQKTGDEDFDYEPGCSFETYSNLDGWK
jgi:Protein of unknown function (DUF4240)